jgi:hypothetical protein
MSEAKTYQGSCHCGRVKYEVSLDLSKPVLACNCSMCGRSGTLLTFVGADTFKLLSGEDSLGDYQFNKHIIHHLFCKTCGIKAFARGKKQTGEAMVAVNARCLEGVDVGALTIKQIDGKSA